MKAIVMPVTSLYAHQPAVPPAGRLAGARRAQPGL
jgi:hypothetical protein